MGLDFHGRYLELVGEIERRFPVRDWSVGDVDVWPLARMDLYLDLYAQAAGEASAAATRRSYARRAVSGGARWARTLWKSRGDLVHYQPLPHRADAIFLGDGVSLDRIDGAWQDRFGEPLMGAIEARGERVFAMQAGEAARLPWRRPTFAANGVDALGRLVEQRSAPVDLPGHEQVAGLLAAAGVDAPSMRREVLQRRAGGVAGAARMFGWILSVARPRLAFVSTFYGGLGPAFALACRRRGVLCVDLQNSPHDGAHKAYGWGTPLAGGYRTLPSAFWSWTQGDAEGTASDWPRSIDGGHSQIAAMQADAVTQGWDACFESLACAGKREILVALQPIAGHRGDWEDLAAQIEAAPPTWRWWIRRHPASHPGQDAEYGRLLRLDRPNVLIAPASALPLPVLLRRMSAVVSLASGAAGEAEMFGVPALFLSPAAGAIFPGMISRGAARVVSNDQLAGQIGRLPAAPHARRAPRQPAIGETLARLDVMAADFAAFCARERGDTR